MTGLAGMDSAGFVMLGLVALVGLILKLAILFNIELKTPLARSFAILCLILLLQNVAEFLTYFTYLKSESTGRLLFNCYMLVVYFIAPALLTLVLRLVESKYVFQISVASYLGSVIIAILHMSGLVITGYEFIGWSIISTPGQFYGVSMLVIAFNLLLAVGMLAFTIFTSSSTHIVSRCKVSLLAFTPMLTVFAGVQLARLAGFQSSSAISLPIATLLFLFIMLHETKDNLYWLSTKFQMVFALLMMDKS
ncbi:MAG: hypothetical protein WD772_07915, partial [Pseudohongiellaceae bacterium]